MRDDYGDQLGRDGREQINSGIDRLLSRVMRAFCVLHAIQWSAPWTDTPRCRS